MQYRALVLLAFTAGLAAGPLSGQRADSITSSPAEKFGGSQATVVIEEYSDFQCPYCAAHEMKFAEAVQQWVAKQKGDVRFEFYDVALPRHLAAGLAAHAARCAGAQGHYDEARHALFAEQQQWAAAPDASLRVAELARSFVRDTTRFNSCLLRDAWRTDRILAANLKRARDLDVPGTPTFLIFVGDHVAQIVDPASPDSMAAVVRSLKEKH